MLDRLLLVACVCISAVSFFYFFHWNQLLAWIISFSLRLLYWDPRDELSVYYDIGSFHLSLINGRILIKEFRYYSTNQTIKVAKIEVVWRYWARRPTTDDEIGPNHGGEPQDLKRALSCRLQFNMSGVEWFLQNRSDSYNALLERIISGQKPHDLSETRPEGSKDAKVTTDSTIKMPEFVRRAIAWLKQLWPNFDLPDTFPLGITMDHGNFTIGNSSTPNLLVAEWQRATTLRGVVPAKSKYDLYRHLIIATFHDLVIRWVQNPDYQGSTYEVGEFATDHMDETPDIDKFPAMGYDATNLEYKPFTTKLWTLFRPYFIPSKRRSRRTKAPRKSSDDATPVGPEFLSSEYAVERTLVEAPMFEVCLGIDEPGLVPNLPDSQPTRDPFDIGNRDAGPEYNVDIIIFGGVLRYGPWADRQRAELQRTFAPMDFRDDYPHPRRKPGEVRLWPNAKYFFELRDQTVLHVPFREASKNWQWDGVLEDFRIPRKREPAFIHISAGDRSTINYTAPSVPDNEGYHSSFEIHLDTVSVTSSINDIRLVSAESCRIHGDLPSPLKWNGQRTWHIGVTFRQPVFYLIRDHINLLEDLGKDWTSGPPVDYYRFVPTIYEFHLFLHHYQVNLFANDHNIIDKPRSREENVLFVLFGSFLETHVVVPSQQYRPESTTVTVTTSAPHARLNLCLPRWNTNALHVPKEGRSLAKVDHFQLTLSYHYHSEVREEYVEQLVLKIQAAKIAYKLLGWSIRYFMILKENYLGSFTQFSTLYEFLDKRTKGLPTSDPVLQKYRPGKSNMLQAELFINVQKSDIILPAGLPGYEQSCTGPSIGPCLIIGWPELQLYFRLHDFFMDMSLNFSEVSANLEMVYPEDDNLTELKSPDLFVIDGIDLAINRLFGPPPGTLMYAFTVEIDVGAVRAKVSAQEIALLQSIAQSFLFNLDDPLNAPAAEYREPVLPDVTFVKFTLHQLNLTWTAENTATVLSLPEGIKLDTNNLGGDFHKRMASVRMPGAIIRVLVSPQKDAAPWLEAAEVTGDCYLDIYLAPDGWREMAAVQAEFVEEQDRRTHRYERMFDSLIRRPSAPPVSPTVTNGYMHGLYLPQPSLSSYRRYQDAKAPAGDGRLSRLSFSSESDGGSETNWDAVVAQTRSQASGLNTLEEEPMTSGDESDTADSDAESDSDWSFLDTQEPSTSVFRQYSRFVRHYQPWSKDRCEITFNLTKDKSRSFASSRLKSGYLENKHPHFTVAGQDVDLIVVRLTARRGIFANVTPLIVPALTRLEADLEAITWSPELLIDSLLTSFVNAHDRLDESAPDPAAKVSKNISLDLRIPGIQIQLLQQVPNPDPNAAYPDLPTMTMLELGVSGIHAVARIKKQSTSLYITVTQLFLTLSTTANVNMALSLSLDRFSLTSLPDDMDVYFGDFILKLSHSGPAYFLRFAEASMRNADHLKTIYHRYTSHASTSRIHLISQVLESSKDQQAIDPLSAIQPLYLVQSGRPHELRIDPVFRFLFHLRDALWHIRNVDKLSLSPEASTIEELFPELQTRLSHLDPDIDINRLDSLFPQIRDITWPLPGTNGGPRRKAMKYHFRYGTFRLDSFQVHVLELSGSRKYRKVSSEFTLSHFRVTARYRRLDLIQTGMAHRLGNHHANKLSVTVTIGNVNLVVFSHLLRFAQEVLRVSRLHPSTLPKDSSANKTDRPDLLFDHVIDVTFALHSFRAQAVAESLIFELGATSLKSSSSILVRPTDFSVTHVMLFDEVAIAARSGKNSSNREKDVLASFSLQHGRVNTVIRQDPPSSPRCRFVFGLQNVHLRIPRSALRLYRFVEEWQADFFPEVEATVKALVSELQQPPSEPRPPLKSRRWPTIQLDGHVASFGIFLQVMHGTWLTWEVNDIVLYINSTSPTPRENSHSFGLHTSSQVFCVSSSSGVPTKSINPKARLRLQLPPISISGSYGNNFIRVIALMDFIEVRLKPSHWDTVLAVQQKFGQDFNDFLSLVQRTRERRPVPNTPKTPKSNAGSTLNACIYWKMRGFRIGLEGPTSTFYFECLNIDGNLQNRPTRVWSITLSDLALSLASRAFTPHTLSSTTSSFNRRQRSAFVIVDIKVTGGTHQGESSHATLQATIPKVHAVMQPSSIGEVGDFLDHLQAELLEGKEQRTQEMAAFKIKAQSILKTFEVKVKDAEEVKETSSWLSQYTIDLAIRNIGVAFPLSLLPDLQLPQMGDHDSGAVKAFLFSIKSLKFSAQKGETGEATMKGFSFQFVSRFRQSVPSDFLGESHQTRNRLLYPEMTAQLRSKRSASSRQVLVKADVSGFILDLDSSIPDYVFSLIDVYRHGKERVAQLSSTLPPISSRDAAKEAIQALENRYSNVPAANVFASSTFFSGKVRIFSHNASLLSRPASHSATDLSDQQLSDIGAEIFNLPMVSVWSEYRAKPLTRDVSDAPMSILMFKATVHSSENTLRPTLLPFFTEVITRVEGRLKTHTRTPRSSLSQLPTTTSEAAIAESPVTQETEPTSSMQISFSLRIDKSKLELTCKPDVNVIAGLHWQSGGFMVNISPGARRVAFIGRVGGLTIGIRHGFLSEDCVRLDARNLAFTMTFAKMDIDDDKGVSFASLVVDTELLGAVRFSRLQDILCFKAVWLDHIPMLNGNHSSPPPPSTAYPIIPDLTGNFPKQEFTNVILVRIRKIGLDIDLGHSISTVVLDVSDAILRTRLMETMNEFSLWVGDVKLNGTGNVAGQITVANCVFETIRRRTQTRDGLGRSRMLELRMTSGPLVAVVESDHQRLLHYRAEPLEVEIYDDWSIRIPESDRILGMDRPLQLSFTVNSPEVVAVATVSTIPKLMLYVNKFLANLEAQRAGASHDSRTFRASRSPQPDNPLSAVAEAMLHSARSRFKETGLAYVVKQRMSLKLDLLRLVVFPRSMGDPETAQFVARRVRAELNRLVHPDTKRDIHLAFSSMVISRFTQSGHYFPSSPDMNDGKEWLSNLLKDCVEANIVGLPSMTMFMKCDETIEDGKTILSYDFDSKFVRKSGEKDFAEEDIYITLNVGLYSWLTLLRKSLSREMEQVKTVSDWKSLAPPAPAITSRRGRAPALEPLQIDSPKTATLIKSSTFPLSPASPIEPRSSGPHSAALLASGWPASPEDVDAASPAGSSSKTVVYRPRTRHIERLTMRQLGEATPDVMHPFFMKKAGFSLEDSLPQYVHEYATTPLEEIMEVLLKVYSKQLAKA